MFIQKLVVCLYHFNSLTKNDNMKRLLIFIIPLLLCSTTQPPDRGDTLLNCKNKKVSLFLNSIWADAEMISQLYNIPIELILAQSAQETGFGTSKKCVQDCNYFGIQGGQYSNKIECFFDYARVLSLPCYDNLQPKTLEDWFIALECCKYAGDPNYIKSLKKIIKKHLK